MAKPKKASVRKWALWGAVVFATIGSAYCFRAYQEGRRRAARERPAFNEQFELGLK